MPAMVSKVARPHRAVLAAAVSAVGYAHEGEWARGAPVLPGVTTARGAVTSCGEPVRKRARVGGHPASLGAGQCAISHEAAPASPLRAKAPAAAATRPPFDLSLASPVPFPRVAGHIQRLGSANVWLRCADGATLRLAAGVADGLLDRAPVQTARGRWGELVLRAPGWARATAPLSARPSLRPRLVLTDKTYYDDYSSLSRFERYERVCWKSQFEFPICRRDGRAEGASSGATAPALEMRLGHIVVTVTVAAPL